MRREPEVPRIKQTVPARVKRRGARMEGWMGRFSSVVVFILQGRGS